MYILELKPSDSAIILVCGKSSSAAVNWMLIFVSLSDIISNRRYNKVTGLYYGSSVTFGNLVSAGWLDCHYHS